MELSEKLQKQIAQDFAKKDELLSVDACKDENAIRVKKQNFGVLRREFTRDVEAIINMQQFNRYAGKTQVFSLQRNNDVSYRSYHVQLVSRIARTIASALNLNLDLVEAISLAHDLGHSPFGHQGEVYIDNISKNYGYRFNHNVQSARYLCEVMKESNISLQVIDGALCHNGEKTHQVYQANKTATKDFLHLKEKLEKCYQGKITDDELMPKTVEGCLVRLCDVIAYLGKDIQDAQKIGVLPKDDDVISTRIGNKNSDFIRNITNDVVRNSYGKNYIAVSDSVFEDIEKIKAFNYAKIYGSDFVKLNNEKMQKMFKDIFNFLYQDLTQNDGQILRKIYFPFVSYSFDEKEYLCENKKTPERVVVDFIASMCDEYMIEFYKAISKDNNIDADLTINNYKFL